MAEIRPNIGVEYTDEAVIVTFTDRKILEEQDIRALQESIMSVIDQTDNISLILDFANVEFLSSAVLGLLIRLSKHILDRGGRLRLCNISPKIHEVFKITQLTKVFDIHPDVQSALDSLD
ncbi:STAS domain-containing protein [Planctomycetota bacterium]